MFVKASNLLTTKTSITKKNVYSLILLTAVLFSLGSCSTTQVVTLPPASDVFITTGDGDIQKPYTPVAEYLYSASSFKISFIPLIGLINFNKINAEYIIRTLIAQKIKEVGGDGLINMHFSFTKGKPGILGMGSTPDQIFIQGTIIKR